jgi:hypothetical protein
MKTIVGCFLGLVALLTFSVGSPVYADELDAEASALSVLAPDAGANGVESLDNTHCVLYSDGADNCIVNVQPEVVDEGATTFSEIDSSPTEEAPAIRFLDAIPVAVVQTVTIAAPGADNGDREETTAARPMLMPAPEGVSDHDDRDIETATGALVGQSADAIVVAIVQSATIAVPGQSERGGEKLPLAELQLAPAASISTLEAKTTDHDGEE